VSTKTNSQRSLFPEFYKLTVADRVRLMRERGWLTESDYQSLISGSQTLQVQSADKMIENVVGVFGLPLGMGLNMLINGKDYIVPLVVEEPSIVAALSSAAKTVRACGGFTAKSTEPIIIGQVQVVDVPQVAKAQAALQERKGEILNLANSLHPQMVARGGGAKDLEVVIHPRPDGGDMLVVHLLVDTRDAMGANLVNTMCEGVASLVESITDGKVFLRILSNLTDRAMVKSRCVIPLDKLGGRGYDGEQVREAMMLASEFADIDPYRATTNNKGVMNGVDAVALATGNDWRAIEAAAHAYAARSGRYSPLTRWYKGTAKGEEGALVGEIEIPMKVGIVGGTQKSNTTVALNLRLLGVKSACELAEVMGSVGLAQNFSAIRALATEGIQQGHMTLHARAVAASAGATPEIFETVVDRLIESGEIKVWKAQEIVAQMGNRARAAPDGPAPHPQAHGHGKVILLGEHAVVYGSHAIAAPLPLAVQAAVRDTDAGGIDLLIPRWGVEYRLHRDQAHRDSYRRALGIVCDQLGLTARSMRIEVFPNVPRAMGLGASAAMAVAIVRALDEHFRLGLSDERVNALAYECEKVAHGTPSGIDNTVATYGRFILYRRARAGERAPTMRDIRVPRPIPVVIGISGNESLTAKTVGAVRAAWQKSPQMYERIFRAIDALTLQGADAIERYDLERLGELMNVCHGLLNALRVSSWQLEQMAQIAREHGALGAKLTGGGGGGSIIALCADNRDEVIAALQDAGYQGIEVRLGQPGTQ
jgi:hydroxymethylglutaryl-CoA reductase